MKQRTMGSIPGPIQVRCSESAQNGTQQSSLALQHRRLGKAGRYNRSPWPGFGWAAGGGSPRKGRGSLKTRSCKPFRPRAMQSSSSSERGTLRLAEGPTKSSGSPPCPAARRSPSRAPTGTAARTPPSLRSSGTNTQGLEGTRRSSRTKAPASAGDWINSESIPLRGVRERDCERPAQEWAQPEQRRP